MPEGSWCSGWRYASTHCPPMLGCMNDGGRRALFSKSGSGNSSRLLTPRESFAERAERSGHRRDPESRHMVSCPYCAVRFDLFVASWCAHLENEASKMCPACSRCVCDHPAYAEPHFWVPAPVAFERHGFRRLFLLYL